MDAFNNVKWSAGGRQYPALEKLLKDCSPEVERELYRLAQDIEAEKRMAVTKAVRSGRFF